MLEMNSSLKESTTIGTVVDTMSWRQEHTQSLTKCFQGNGEETRPSDLQNLSNRRYSLGGINKSKPTLIDLVRTKQYSSYRLQQKQLQAENSNACVEVTSWRKTVTIAQTMEHNDSVSKAPEYYQLMKRQKINFTQNRRHSVGNLKSWRGKSTMTQIIQKTETRSTYDPSKLPKYCDMILSQQMIKTELENLSPRRHSVGSLNSWREYSAKTIQMEQIQKRQVIINPSTPLKMTDLSAPQQKVSFYERQHNAGDSNICKKGTAMNALTQQRSENSSSEKVKEIKLNWVELAERQEQKLNESISEALKLLKEELLKSYKRVTPPASHAVPMPPQQWSLDSKKQNSSPESID